MRWMHRVRSARDMPMRILALIALAPFLALAVPAAAQTQYVRDELRVNMRTGPGNQYRITRVLVSGDAVTHLAENDGWVQIRAADGEEGWVPSGYVGAATPASVSLPRAEAKLAQAQARVEELEGRLGSQTDAITELETLRARNLELETENIQLVGSARWKSLGIGALIAAAGVALGAMWPRGGASRARRIKL